MKNSIQCPICGKTGIPNFHKEDVVCPCCGSDLSVYHNLYDLSGKGVVYKKYKYMILIAITLLVLAVAYIFLDFQKDQSNKSQIIKLQEQTSLLKDSIEGLKQALTIRSKRQTTVPSNDKVKLYVVKRGDSFCKISKTLYGTEIRYIEIIKLNNLNVETILHKGDSIKVPIK